MVLKFLALMRGSLGSESHEYLLVGVLIHAKFNHLNFTIRTLYDRAGKGRDFWQCAVVAFDFNQRAVGDRTLAQF
jgi:hypothetical protein